MAQSNAGRPARTPGGPPAAATRAYTAHPSSRNSWSYRQVTMPTPRLAGVWAGKISIPDLEDFPVEAAIGTCRWPQRSGSHRDSRSRGWYNRGDKAAAREWRSADAETDIHCSSNNVASSSFYRVDVVHIRTSLSARHRRSQCPYESGVIVEGMKVFASWRPEVWTAIGILTIASFSAILGVFAIGLARSTQIAADAAKLASQVAVGAERAHLFIHIETENIVSAISQGSKGAASPKERPPAYFVFPMP